RINSPLPTSAPATRFILPRPWASRTASSPIPRPITNGFRRGPLSSAPFRFESLRRRDMSKPSEQELEEFRAEAAAWVKENKPADPGFMLPLTFMEVGTDQQFEFLRDWQRKVYEAGYIAAAWPEEYGGRGMHQAFQDVASAELAKART